MTTRNPGNRELPRLIRDATLRFRIRAKDGAHGAFDAEISRAGLRPSVKTTVRTGPAPEGLASQLGVQPGEHVLIRAREMYADDIPVQLATSWLPLDIAKGTAIEQVDTGRGGTYSRLAELGHTITQFAEAISVSLPADHEADFLRLGPGQLIYNIRRTAADQDGRVVEVTDTTMSVTRFGLVYRWPAES